MSRGKFIVVYGINGIGKTTQIDNVLQFVRMHGIEINYLKYPIYDLEPEGPFINSYLRDKKFRKANPQTPEEEQEKYTENRRRFQPKLQEILESGIWVLAEDYIGTGLVWGMTKGADLEFLEAINDGLVRPDLEILLHGDRFKTAIEAGHSNEGDEKGIKVAKNFHFLLAGRYGWEVINANQEKSKVSADIEERIKLLIPWSGFE